MENIQKVINLNGFIRELKKNTYYAENLETYTEEVFNQYPKRYKIHSIAYGDGYINIIIVDDNYRFFYSYPDGLEIEDYETIDQLRKKVYSMI